MVDPLTRDLYQWAQENAPDLYEYLCLMDHSREKGKRGELELRDFLVKHGWEARRGGQQGDGGSADAPDVIHNIPAVHIECKRVEAFSCVTRAMQQSIRDAGNKEPTVFCRTNGSEWYVIQRAEDYLASKEIYK